MWMARPAQPSHSWLYIGLTALIPLAFAAQDKTSGKTWDSVATACNLEGGYRLANVKVMTHFGQPDAVRSWPG